MDGINENAGILILVIGIIVVALCAVLIFALFDLRSRIAVQKLKFIGFYAADPETHERSAKFTVGNKSLNDVGISEIGLKNGKVSFDFTTVYREKNGIQTGAKIVLEQRTSLKMELTVDEIMRVIYENAKGKRILKTLRCYAVDFTGNLYEGKVPNVKKMLMEVLQERALMAKQAAKGKEPVAKAFSAPMAKPAVPVQEQPAPAWNPEPQTETPTWNPEPQTETPNWNPEPQTETPSWNPEPQAETPTWNPEPQTETPSWNPEPQAETPSWNPEPQTETPSWNPEAQTEAPTEPSEPEVSEEEAPDIPEDPEYDEDYAYPESKSDADDEEPLD